MNDEPISSDEFRREVEDAASVITTRGFKRVPQFEAETPTMASVVYVGKNLAFTFTLDVRDQAIDLMVTRYRGGKLLATWDGGYSSSLFAHLLKHCGFRGRPTPPPSLPSTASKVQRMIAANLNLLAHNSAASLLADEPGALPG